MRRSTICLTIIALTGVGVYFFLSWLTAQDSWAHYDGGGYFVTQGPFLAPNGSALVYASPRSGHGDIYLMSQDGKRHVRLTSDSDFESDPLFSPDGSFIVFVRESRGVRHIWMMDVNGGSARQITNGRVLDCILGFNRDGSRLIFHRAIPHVGLGNPVDAYSVEIKGLDQARFVAIPFEGVVPRESESIPFDPTLKVNVVRMDEYTGDQRGDLTRDPQRHLGNSGLPAKTPRGVRVRYAKQDDQSAEL